MAVESYPQLNARKCLTRSTIHDILSGMVGGVSVAFMQQLAGARLLVPLSK